MTDMKITCIHHNSLMAEPDHAVLLFDYSEGNISETDREEPLFVFANHRHGDHFSRSTFDLEESRGNVAYMLSDDIWTRQVPEGLLGRTIFLGPGEEMSLKDGTGNLMDVRASRPTGQGVAFLASLEGRTICHAGGLNNWIWEGKPEADNYKMSENFHWEMDKLVGRHIDMASMPIDPRQERDFYLGMDDFMRMVGTDVVSPMRFWEDFQAAVRFEALACADGYRDGIQEIHRQGEEFPM